VFDSMYVELTSLCNMSCDFCVSRFMKRQKTHMDFGMFTNVIDQIAQNKLTKNIQLAAIGESLLYPKLIEAVRYCREKKLEPAIITNGLLLTKDLYQNLADSGLREVQISFHNLTQESFAYRHAGPNAGYSLFFQNLIGLIDYHVARKVPVRLVVDLMFCKKDWISSELWDLPAIKEDTKNAVTLLKPFIEAMGKIAKKNNIKCYLSSKQAGRSIRALSTLKYRLFRIMDNVYLNITSLNPQIFNTRDKLKGPLGNKIKLIRKTRGVCQFLNAPMVLSNGSFIPCCIDGLEELVMGRVEHEKSLLSIIEGEKYQNLIQGFKNRNIINPLCQECLGILEYKDRLLRTACLFKRLDPYACVSSLIYAGKEGLRRLWWNKLNKEHKRSIKSTLKKIRIS